MTPSTPLSPFKGLSAFDDSEVDALLFFGREREREIVVANLIASRLTVLYGPSGVGKSSLLRAGVARSLRELPEKPLVLVFSRWSDDPATALAAAIGTATGTGQNGSVLELLERAQSGRDVYLVLDQTEEYFLYHSDDAGFESFAEALPAALAAPYRINILVSIREDSLAKLDRFTGQIPGVFANTLRLDRLDRESARAAIVRPVERYAELTGEEVGIEPALVERVLDEAGAGRIEPALGGVGAVDETTPDARIEAPYLQLVLQRLWDEERAAGSDELRAETLERLGGAEHIVEEHLQGAMDELTPEQKEVAARLFNHLVTPSGMKIAHEVSDLAEFGRVSSDELRPILATLADRRILRSVDEGAGIRYEIFHDVLGQPVLAWRTRHRTEREVERQLAERQRRRSRIQRLLAVGAAVVGLVALVTVFALLQRANANEQSREAAARKLDATAIRQLEEDPELSLLLASESARTAAAATAEDALRRSLLTSRVRDLYRTDGPVTALSVSPDGHLAFASDDGRVRVAEPAAGRQTVLDVGPGGGVSFARNGRLLVYGGSTPAQIVAPGTAAKSCELGTGPAASATMAGDFSVVVRNGIGYVWDATTCELVHTIGRVGQTAVRVVASPDGQRVAFLSGREARVADVATGRIRHRLVHPGEITSLAFSADGRRIVTGGRDRLARVWNGMTGKMLHELEGHQGQVLDVAIGLAGAEIATASTDGTARVWDAATGELRAPLFGHTNFVRAVDFSPDGQSLVTASVDGTARTWALNGRRLATLAGHEGPVLDAQFSPDGYSVVTAGQDGSVRVWDAGTRPNLRRAQLERPEPGGRMATSDDGVIATADGPLVRLERPDGATSELAGHRLEISSVGFSPDGTRLVTAGRDHDVILWDVESERPLRVLRGHFGSVSDARFSPDGRWIVTAGPRSVGVWKASDGELTQLLFGPEGPFTAATFLADSRTIVAQTENGVVSSYVCRICGDIPELLALADERLAATGRELTPEELELYLG
jgi:WD40 repeat protein